MNARVIALRTLENIDRHHHFADESFTLHIERSSLSELDRSLAFELVYGVLRWRETLDWRLNHVSNRPVQRLPVRVVMALRLGAYQMLYLDRIPVSAAVNESVNLVKTIRTRDWSRFVNGTLRSLARQDHPSWPDVSDDPIKALSIRYACPPWIVQRWLAHWSLSETETLCEATLKTPPLTLRTNTIRCSRSTLFMRLQRAGYDVSETRASPVGLVLKKCGSLNKLDVLQEGWCYVEDEAAQIVPLLLDVQPGHRVLDACAAPGGKTTHLAQLMNNQGTIVAMDRDSRRLQILKENCTRLGVTIVEPLSVDVSKDFHDSLNFPNTQHSWEDRSFSHTPQFDRILVDAPCSGLGVLRRHPEGKWAKGPDLIRQAQSNQTQILDAVCDLLRPGGVLVYSACSTEREETCQVLSSFVQRHSEFHQESVKPWLRQSGESLCNKDGNLLTSFASYDMDGFFATRLRKIGTT